MSKILGKVATLSIKILCAYLGIAILSYFIFFAIFVCLVMYSKVQIAILAGGTLYSLAALIYCKIKKPTDGLTKKTAPFYILYLIESAIATGMYFYIDWFMKSGNFW